MPETQIITARRFGYTSRSSIKGVALGADLAAKFALSLTPLTCQPRLHGRKHCQISRALRVPSILDLTLPKRCSDPGVTVCLREETENGSRFLEATRKSQ